MTDVVLARPGFLHKAEKYWSNALPLGIGYLASSARNNNLSVKVVDGKLNQHTKVSQTVNEIIRQQPQFVGLSTMTVDFPLSHHIAQVIKQELPNCIIFAGGPHINALPKESLKESPYIDYVISGQAEESFCEALLKLKNHSLPESIKGLYYRFGNQMIEHKENDQITTDLTTLPFPAWDLFPKKRYYPIMTERGCPFHCVFCSHNLSRKIRSRPVEHVMEEVRWLYKHFQASHISFEDETFGLNKKRTLQLLEQLVLFNEKANLSYGAQTRVDCFSLEMALLMKKAGFTFISFGIESGDQQVLKNAGKNIKLEQVYKTVDIARRAKLKIWPKFIIGLPRETKESVRNTINLAVKLNPERFSAATIVAYPGSKIYEWACKNENGYSLLTKNWNKFDKYLANSIELETLKSWHLKRLQIQLVIEVYLRNWRLRELYGIVKNNFSALFLVIINLFNSFISFIQKKES